MYFCVFKIIVKLQSNLVNMRKLYIVLLTLFLSPLIYSQTWFEAGFRGGPTTTFLTNKNLFDDTGYDHVFTPSYFYAGKIGINFGEENGVAINIGGSQVHQRFVNNYEERIFNQRSFKANTFDVGILYHRTKASGYFEAGPKISMINSGQTEDDNTHSIDVKNQLKSTMVGMDLGFGSYVIGSERLALITGFRLSYGFSPLMDNEMVVAPHNANYDNSRGVHVFALMFSAEINYSLGYLVRASCGKRTAWISF